MGILPRHVLAEVIKIFAISLVALTLMMIIVGLVREATQQGLPMAQALRLIPYILPDALRMTVPVTLLLATTSVYARMSGANEVVAIKALGISPVVLLRPLWALAFLVSLGAVWLNDLAVSGDAAISSGSSSMRSKRSSTACSARNTATVRPTSRST